MSSKVLLGMPNLDIVLVEKPLVANVFNNNNKITITVITLIVIITTTPTFIIDNID